MPRNYHSSAAKCPFYRGERYDQREGGAALFCAGVGKAETIRLFFRSKDKLLEHAELCRGEWEDCSIAQLLKSTEEENHE